MKIKIISLILIVTIITITCLLFIKKEEKVIIISTQKIYSIVRSDIHEEITFPLLINIEDSPYITNEYINDVTLSDPNNKIILPFKITEVRKDDIIVYYNNDIYYQYYIDGIVNVDSSDYTINIEKAYLNITYTNSTKLKLLIGEFNISFYSSFNKDLSLSNLEGVFCDINTVTTVCGVKIKLVNNTEDNLFINSINILSTSAQVPNYYLKEIDYNYTTINDLTNSLEYDHFKNIDFYEQTILFKKHEAKSLFFPINYIGEISYLNQFGIEVFYEQKGNKKTIIIDDFLFMSTSPFRKEVEEYYTIYEISN